MIGIIAACALYGGALGYVLGECFEAEELSRKISRETEEITKNFEELIDRELQRQDEISQILDDLSDSTKSELEASIRYAEMCGVDEEFILRTREDALKFFEE